MSSHHRSIDCLLLAPPDVGPVFPRGIMELGSYLIQAGFEISVVPLAHPLNAGVGETVDDVRLRRILGPLLEDLRPRVVGISNLFTMHHPTCERIAGLCKEHSPLSVVVMGGPHPTFMDEAVAKSNWVDAVVRGEGEETMVEVLSAVRSGSGLATIAGITLRVDGRVVRNPDRAIVEQLESLPPINFNLLPAEYLQQCHVYGFMNRGCAFECAFCAEHVFWRKRRDYAVERVLAEIETLDRTYGNLMVGIEDSMVYIGAEQFHSFCSGIEKRGLHLSPDFFVLSRVDTITKRGAASMQRAGIRHARLGIESGSPYVRRQMGKNFSNEKIAESCALLRQHEVETLAFWIIGHPGDDPKESSLSLSFLNWLFEEKLVGRAVLSIFLPYPGTQFFARPETYGIRILRPGWSDWQRWGGQPASELATFSADQIVAAYEEALTILARHGQHLRQIPHEAEFSAHLADWVRQRDGRSGKS